MHEAASQVFKAIGLDRSVRRNPASGGWEYCRDSSGGSFVSIVRIGLAETKNFAEGYDAIFGKKKGTQPKKGGAADKSGQARKKKKVKKK